MHTAERSGVRFSFFFSLLGHEFRSYALYSTGMSVRCGGGGGGVKVAFSEKGVGSMHEVMYVRVDC